MDFFLLSVLGCIRDVCGCKTCFKVHLWTFESFFISSNKARNDLTFAALYPVYPCGMSFLTGNSAEICGASIRHDDKFPSKQTPFGNYVNYWAICWSGLWRMGFQPDLGAFVWPHQKLYFHSLSLRKRTTKPPHILDANPSTNGFSLIIISNHLGHFV